MDISISRTLLAPAQSYAFTTIANDDFNAKLQAAHIGEANAEQDLSYLSVGSYEQRLEKLWKLHRNTDYSDMSSWDRLRLLDNRMEQAFPEDYGGIFSGVYSFIDPNSVYAHVYEEASKIYGEVMKGQPKIQLSELGELTRYRNGYEGLSDDEIRAKVNEKYSRGTLIDRYAAALELSNLRIDDEASGFVTMQIYNELVKGTEQQYGYLDRDHPIRRNAMLQYARGTTMSWKTLVNHAIKTITDGILFSEHSNLTVQEKQDLLWEVKTSLWDFLDHMSQN